MATSKMKETSIEKKEERKKQKHKRWDKQYSPCFCENGLGAGSRREAKEVNAQPLHSKPLRR